jgi:hypothetical protein
LGAVAAYSSRTVAERYPKVRDAGTTTIGWGA